MVASQSSSVTLNNTQTDSFKIGSLQPLLSSIDEVRYWSSVLSAKDVSQLYISLNQSQKYFYVANVMNWQAAKSDCIARGAHLATILSSAQNNSVYQLIPSSITNVWIGGEQSPSGSEPGGGWGWVTGEAFSYTNWGVNPASPDNFQGNQECLVMWGPSAGYTSPGQWDDLQCIYASGFPHICEYD